MEFKKSTSVTSEGVQTDTYELKIPFSELPEYAVMELKAIETEWPETRIDYNDEAIFIVEEVIHG